MKNENFVIVAQKKETSFPYCFSIDEIYAYRNKTIDKKIGGFLLDGINLVVVKDDIDYLMNAILHFCQPKHTCKRVMIWNTDQERVEEINNIVSTIACMSNHKQVEVITSLEQIQTIPVRIGQMV